MVNQAGSTSMAYEFPVAPPTSTGRTAAGFGSAYTCGSEVTCDVAVESNSLEGWTSSLVDETMENMVVLTAWHGLSQFDMV